MHAFIHYVNCTRSMVHSHGSAATCSTPGKLLITDYHKKALPLMKCIRRYA